MADFSSKYVACPYFRRNEVKNNRICCEGVSDGNTVNIVFGSPKQLVAYQQQYCNEVKQCHTCLIARMLDHKWEGAVDIPGDRSGHHTKEGIGQHSK